MSFMVNYDKSNSNQLTIRYIGLFQTETVFPQLTRDHHEEKFHSFGSHTVGHPAVDGHDGRGGGTAAMELAVQYSLQM